MFWINQTIAPTKNPYISALLWNSYVYSKTPLLVVHIFQSESRSASYNENAMDSCNFQRRHCRYYGAGKYGNTFSFETQEIVQLETKRFQKEH